MSYMTVDDAAFITNMKQETFRGAIHETIVRVQQQIKRASVMGLTETKYAIPLFHLDYPRTNPDTEAEEVAKHFRQQGFYTKILQDVTSQQPHVYVSWRTKTLEERKKKQK